MDDLARAKSAIEALTGEYLPSSPNHCDRAFLVLSDLDAHPIGYSQFNEILLCCGFDRINPDYFDFLFSGPLNPKPAPRISGVDQIEKAARRGQQLALLAFGNARFGFRQFAPNNGVVKTWVEFLTPIGVDRFVHRLSAAIPIEDIPVSKRHLLGYVSGASIAEDLKKNPTDPKAIEADAEQKRLIEIGKRNQLAYLVSDHLDIYVATSMRQTHEYAAIASFCTDLFAHKELSALNLRYFDPTMAYAPDRIDKGLSEALMLKRARVTIFLAQETDTLGKDSELASTLAQGKVVIAYVPNADTAFFAALEKDLTTAYPADGLAVLLLRQLKYFAPALAWENSTVQRWVRLDSVTLERELSDVRKFFRDIVSKHYDKRADLLRKQHPLGIQANLRSGVAVGVLVVRTLDNCAKVVKAVLTNTMEFKLRTETAPDGSHTHLCLIESISDSIFRVMTYDRSLEKAFWNFYLV